MTKLYKIDNGALVEVNRQMLQNEALLENWIADDPSVIGLELLVIGKQISTDFGGRIDILGMDRYGGLVILELKRDQTPREVVAQVLDYASWVSKLTQNRIHELVTDKHEMSLEELFQKQFEAPLPNKLNNVHSMVIVASEFDEPSRRIVEYLAEEHGISINTAFFNVFELNGQQLLATDWMMDQEEVVERAESMRGPRWTGYYYVNAGEDETNSRLWADMRTYGFIAAGGGRTWSKPLDKLRVDDPIYVYGKGSGYVGFGIVKATSVKSRDFRLQDGRSLAEVELEQNNLLHDQEDDEKTEYIVDVDWKFTVPMEKGKKYPGIFTNPNIVCKLRDIKTLSFLANEFGAL